MKPKLLAMATMFAAMASTSDYGSDEPRTPNEEVLNRQPPKKVIPKGCKEYFFSKYGSMFSERSEDTIFECISSSDKAAQKKFDKFYKTYNP